MMNNKNRTNIIYVLILLLIPAITYWYTQSKEETDTIVKSHKCGDKCTHQHFSQKEQEHIAKMEYKYGTNYRYIGISHIEKWDIAAKNFAEEFVQACPDKAYLQDTVEDMYLSFSEAKLAIVNKCLNKDAHHEAMANCYKQFRRKLYKHLTPDEIKTYTKLVNDNNLLARNTRQLWLKKEK